MFYSSSIDYPVTDSQTAVGTWPTIGENKLYLRHGQGLFPGCRDFANNFYWPLQLGQTKDRERIYIMFYPSAYGCYWLFGPYQLGQTKLRVEKEGDPSLPVLREREKNMMNVTRLLGARMNVILRCGDDNLWEWRDVVTFVRTLMLQMLVQLSRWPCTN